ncbi:MAG TPA: maleylpyruvate isomerase N-terminal domain-containing protein [Aggregatilineales bacterium]|nr:maleylpyruvate isomerase N-terminal domain-containing protein [Aggregatilineales bacterium]
MSDLADHEHLIQGLTHAHQTIKMLVDAIAPKASILYPGWSIKEFLAHLTGWDEAGIACIRAYLDKRVAGVPAYRGLNFYNAQSVTEREALSYEQVYREWELAREQLKATLQTVSSENLHTAILSPWGSQTTIAAMIQILIDHADEHEGDLKKMISPTSDTSTS